KGGVVNTLPGFDEGAWWVQDTAASLPVKLMGSIKGLKIGDLCAAPGGKTAQMLAMGAAVTSVDRSTKRVRILETNLNRLGFVAEVRCEDVLNWRPTGLYDAIMIDAPCTATGTIRRHPDIQWVRSATDVMQAQKIQKSLLSAAVRMIKPKGTIIYVSCSLQPEEGTQVVNSVLSSFKNLHRDPVNPEELMGNKDLITDEGDLRTLPSHMSELGGMDGFYAARLVYG
ncbi:MAG: RsmB/NOP family class I SAM-dependent RNA methyltransferase, partial [Pseudomonadota bacterium]|nr:RsmB/NOP family class I SAM-dependent RNA methyltransferase [Pseudomonadota bacterium]